MEEKDIRSLSAVTIVATVLNEVEDIDLLVTSLMHQTLAPAEVIVVDGGSTDGTWERLLAAKAKYPALIPIHDESCKLPHSRSPVARGRNVAITAASSEVIACADAGCAYEPSWLERLTDAIRKGESEYALGGSRLDPEQSTVWDVASAAFFGVRLSADAKTQSCTARSMAFRKALWRRVGGFPERNLLGEDALFDLQVRSLVRPSLPRYAKALYRPRHTLSSALRQLARYSASDGVSGVRHARLVRNLARCVVETASLLLVTRTSVPLLCVFSLEVFFAFRLDWRDLRGVSPKVLAARLLFSLLVPWVVTWNHIRGAVTKVHETNRQNLPQSSDVEVASQKPSGEKPNDVSAESVIPGRIS